MLLKRFGGDHRAKISFTVPSQVRFVSILATTRWEGFAIAKTMGIPSFGARDLILRAHWVFVCVEISFPGVL
jgi:hypothetical protein